MLHKKGEKTGGSSSETDPRHANVDEMKRKRMISNRESAKRSRMRKQKLLEVLASEISALQRENRQMRDNIDLASHKFVEMESANNVLRARAMELTDRLRSLSSVLEIAEAVGGLDVEIPDIPNLLNEPWMQLSHAPSLPTV